VTDKDKQAKQTFPEADPTDSMQSRQALRMQAEGIARENWTPTPAEIAVMRPETIQETIHELLVHRLELEMQNEELRRTQSELLTSQERYFDLYELAPVGYLTISENGIIQKANLTAAILLDMTRETLISQPLSQFIFKDDQDVYYLHRKEQDICTPHMCELRMVKKDGSLFWAHLVITGIHQADNIPLCLLTLSDITEHKELETALRESEERYRLLFESASDALFLIDPDTARIVKANSRGAELYGYDQDEFLTKKITDLSAEPEETMRRFQEIQQKPDAIISIPCRLHRKNDGTIFPVEISARLIPLQNRQVLFVAARDITKRKEAEELLRQSEERRIQVQETANAQLKQQTESLASIYNALDSVGLIVCDLEKSDARISIFSIGAEKLFGYQQTEAIGKSIALIYPPEVVGIIPSRVERFRQGKPMHTFNMILVRKSGEHFPAVISVHPFDAHDGKFRKVVGVFRDISELILIQEQLKTTNEELELRVEQRTLELQETQRQYLHAEKLSAIGKLSASIAHEFNNPLQGILSILNGLKKRAILEPEDKELLDAAISESDRIKDLIRSLQEFNRPSSGKKVAMDVHKSLNAVLLLHKSDFKNKRIAVELKYTEPMPQILAVSDQIKQVFLNLLTNAGDACQESGGMITISTWQENDKVAVAIQDTGIGIKPEQMEHIFQPFYTTKPAVKGTGLGLSVSYGIIKQHQGKIRVESRPGEGTTFTVLLPITGACNAAPATSS
jgi:PAS domain S-box-containing protein